ncbi:MAG: hypothetical protein K0Q79_1107 [Flavipsychrobacter sp.]|nr:hypothetical protein [Flavipsychrobacter sp.]
MIYHIVVGDMAAAPLNDAIVLAPELAGEVVVLKDILNVGPLQKEEGQSFSEMRTAFWQQVINNEKHPVHVDDFERLSDVCVELSKNEEAIAWFWMAPWPADICAYYWLLQYLGKYPGRFFVVNIAGLPFLDANGKVFFPKSISEIQPKEIVKARRLARAVNAAELETDGEEWRKLVAANGGVRTLEGGKRVASKNDDQYDNQLGSFCSHQYQKASKVVNQALSKFVIPTGDIYLGWRLRKMVDIGRLQVQGEMSKTLKDFEVKLPGDGADAQLNLAV